MGAVQGFFKDAASLRIQLTFDNVRLRPTMTDGMVRDPVSGEQLTCDALIEYSVSELWEFRATLSNNTDFEDLLLSDNNNREISAISIDGQSKWRRQELNNTLNYLSSYNNDDQEEKEEESTFVRGCAMQSTPRTQKKTKLSDKASASGFKLKMDHEIDATEKLSKRTMGVLNRITPEKFDKLSQGMLEIIGDLADNEERFTIILDLILNKASTDIEFAEQYAQLCLYLSQQLPSFAHKFE